MMGHIQRLPGPSRDYIKVNLFIAIEISAMKVFFSRG